MQRCKFHVTHGVGNNVNDTKGYLSFLLQSQSFKQNYTPDILRWMEEEIPEVIIIIVSFHLMLLETEDWNKPTSQG